jgi:hypothetical protein
MIVRAGCAYRCGRIENTARMQSKNNENCCRQYFKGVFQNLHTILTLAENNMINQKIFSDYKINT